MRKKQAKKSAPQQEHRLPGLPLVVLHGRREAVLYDCKKILSYEREKLCLLCAKEIVTLSGRALCCRSFTAGTVQVEGELFSVSFGAGEYVT